MCLSKSADATLRAEAIFPDRRIRPEVGVFLILLISSSISFNFLLSPVSLMGPPGDSTSDLFNFRRFAILSSWIVTWAC